MGGADVGTTLVKLALPGRAGGVALSTCPRDAVDEAVGAIRRAGCTRLGLTGSGGAILAGRLPKAIETVRVDEFTAWADGARGLVAGASRFLLVSLGSGTSILRVDGDDVRRVGGTALGGGALLGLGITLAGIADFDEIVALAGRGDRRKVDLFISEIGEVKLPDAFIASSFGRLAREGSSVDASPADLLQAAIGLVAENVAWIAAALASAHDCELVAYGGSTLRDNPLLVALLEGVTRVGGHTPVFLPDAGFIGALGAMGRAMR